MLESTVVDDTLQFGGEGTRLSESGVLAPDLSEIGLEGEDDKSQFVL